MHACELLMANVFVLVCVCVQHLEYVCMRGASVLLLVLFYMKIKKIIIFKVQSWLSAWGWKEEKDGAI